MTRLGLFLVPVFFMLKNSVEIESCRFVLEPSYKKDGSIHSWEILTKSVKKRTLMIIMLMKVFFASVR